MLLQSLTIEHSLSLPLNVTHPKLIAERLESQIHSEVKLKQLSPDDLVVCHLEHFCDFSVG